MSEVSDKITACIKLVLMLFVLLVILTTLFKIMWTWAKTFTLLF